MSTDNTEFDIKAASQRKSCSNALISGCKSCKRLPGIPIFPVRYTVCSILGNDSIPSLPDEIISKFTSITLDHYIDDEGILKKGMPYNRYILRKLRKGYLYIYDEIYGGQWQCFGIHPDGELTAFAPDNPIPPMSLANFSCKNPNNTYASSVLTVPSGESRNLYISYVEYPWSIEHMDRLRTNTLMRQSCMQKFRIENNSNDSLASSEGLLRPKSELIKYLPEYHSRHSQYAIGNIKAISDISRGTLTQETAYDETKYAIETALSSVADTPQVHPGLMMIVHDEIGLIEQLKNLRKEPYNKVKIKAIERPNGLGLREMYWLQSVQKLEEGILQQFNEEIEQIKRKDSPEAHEQYIKEATKLFNDFADNPHNPSPLESSSYTPSSSLVKTHERDVVNTSLMAGKVISEFKKYYDNNKRKQLEHYFNPHFEHIQKSKLMLDANYCDWIKGNLETAIKRYDTTNIENSSYAVHILASLLDEGSILSINSSRLWQWLHEESEKNSSSLIARGICINNDEIISHYDTAQIETDPNEFKANKAPSVYLDTLKLKNWYDIIKKGQKLKEKRNDIMTKELTTPLNAWRAGWKDFWKPYNQLQQAISTSKITLYQQHAAQLKAEMPVTWDKAIDPSPTIKQLQITGAIKAALMKEPLDAHTFKLSKVKVSYEDSLSSIKINNSSYAEKNSQFSDYTPSSFKTGNKTPSNVAFGNFPYSRQDILDNLVHKIADPKRSQTQPDSHRHLFYTEPNINLKREAYNKNNSATKNNFKYGKGTNLVELKSQRKIEYIAISDLSNDILEGMLTEEEKVLIAEQKKVAEAWTTGKSSIIFANLIMSFINLKEAIDSLGKKDAGLVEFWKVIGTSIASIQAAGDLISNMTSYRSANSLNIVEQIDLAKQANLLKFEANLLSKTVAIIGIVDSIITFAKAYKKYKNGGTARDMYIEMTIGSLSLIGSVATLCAGSAVLTPVILTLLVIIIGLSFLLTHLVPKNIENWLRRSLYGKDQETVKGKVFKDMLAEQSSLQMVLKGITVDVELNHVLLRSGTEEKYTDLKTYDLKAKIQYPKTIDEDIHIKILQDDVKLIATIDRLKNGTIDNKYYLSEEMLFSQNESELSLVKDREISEIFSSLDITYILGIDRDIKPNINISFNIQLDESHKRDVFYVSI